MEFLDSPYEMDLQIKHFRRNDVTSEIKIMNRNKSPSYDLISLNVVNKLTRKSIFLTLIFN